MVAGNRLSRYDCCLIKNQNTTVGSTIKLWRHRGGRGASKSQCAHKSAYSPFIRPEEKKPYKPQLGTILKARCGLRYGPCWKTLLMLPGFPGYMISCIFSITDHAERRRFPSMRISVSSSGDKSPAVTMSSSFVAGFIVFWVLYEHILQLNVWIWLQPRVDYSGYANFCELFLCYTGIWWQCAKYMAHIHHRICCDHRSSLPSWRQQCCNWCHRLLSADIGP